MMLQTRACESTLHLLLHCAERTARHARAFSEAAVAHCQAAVTDHTVCLMIGNLPPEDQMQRLLASLPPETRNIVEAAMKGQISSGGGTSKVNFSLDVWNTISSCQCSLAHKTSVCLVFVWSSY